MLTGASCGELLRASAAMPTTVGACLPVEGAAEAVWLGQTAAGERLGR